MSAAPFPGKGKGKGKGGKGKGKGHKHSSIIPAPTTTISSQNSLTSISPTSSPDPTTPTSVPVSATSPPAPSPTPPPSPPPSSVATPPSSLGAPSTDPSDGGQTQSPNDKSTPVLSESNTNVQPMQSASQKSDFADFSESIWVTVNSATPTTMTFSTMTTIDGNAVDSTWAVITSVGGQTSTMSSFIDPSITGTTRSDTGGSRTDNGSVNSSNHLGAIIGAIAGVIIVVVALLFACKTYHHRRTVLRQERQMAESWISRSFSRAMRHGYRDVDMPAEVPAAHARSDSYQDILQDRDSDSFTMRSLSPTPSSAIMSSFGDNNRRILASELVDLQAIGDQVLPETMRVDLTTPLLEPLSFPQLQDPFMDPSSDADPMAPRSLSSPIGTENDRNITGPSRSSTMTNDSINFNRPLSRSSSTLDTFYQSPTGRYDPNPFSDSVSEEQSSLSTIKDRNSSSTKSMAPTLRTARSFNDVSVSGRGTVRGPNLMALMGEANGL